MKTKSFPLLKLFFSAWLLAAFWGEGNAAVPSNWVAGSSYPVGSLVIYEGTTYIATQSISNSASPSTNTASWSSLDAIAGGTSTPTGQPSSTPDTSSLSGLNVPADSPSSNGVVDRGSNWVESDWFGLYHKSGSNVFFHSTLGWIRINDASGGGIWIYQMNVNVWLYTNSEVYPKVYKQNTSQWEVPSAPVLRGGVPSAWSGSSVYSGGSLVIHGGVTHQALREVPAGIQPGSNSTYWQSLEQVAASLSTPAGQPTTTPDTSGISNLVVPNDSSSGSGNGSSTSGGVADVVPSIINFRGRLFDAQGQPKTGNVEVGVRIYDSASGDAAVFYENIGSVSVGNGLYSFQFGSRGSPDLSWVLKNHLQAWLEVSVDGAALSRQRLVSVPYALVAKSVGEGGVADVNGVLSLQPQSGTPTAVPGKVVLFAKPDGKLYYQDLNGTETVIGGGSGGGTPGAGAVTLDMLSPDVKAKLNATSDSNGSAGFPSTLGQKVWGKRYGGSGDDRCYSVVQASDGGYLLVGLSNSNADGDKSESGLIGWDYWAVKVDAAGNKIWDKRYGGSGNDLCYDVVVTPDGGYLLAGYSDSDAEGDKTESSRGGYDYWVLKIDASGAKLWDKRFGGTAGDTCTSIVATSDGGYLLSGRSSSGVGGDKTQDTRGSNDYWVVKIDANGGKLWDKRFGGPEWDNCYGVTTTADGGYLLSGLSASGIGGDKTEDTRGNNDYWVVKIDTSGNKVWDKRFGGAAHDNLASITTTPDGGYLLVGLSESDVGGDKTEVTRGNHDYWVVKIDASGNKVWDKRFGGSSSDRCRNVFATADGGYLLVGLSASGSDGDKSEIGRGDHDYWVVKIDASGNKIWDKRLGGNGTDSCYDVIATKDGDFLLAGFSNSELSGDQSESPRGNYDYWIVKIRGNNFVSGSVGNPAVGAVTLDMLSPEVKAKLNLGVDAIVAIPLGQSPPSGYSLFQGGELEWREVAPVSVARLAFDGVEALDGKIYFAGGYNASLATDVTERYDPATNQWENLNSMSGPRDGMAAAVLNGKFYAIGGKRGVGGTGLSSVEIFDPQTGQWSAGPDLPYAVHRGAAITVGGKILLVGGRNVAEQAINQVLELDPNTNQWSEKTPMPTARHGMTLVLREGEVWAIGGASTIRTDKVEIYDVTNDTWETGPSLTTARLYPSAWVANDRIYVAGGLDEASNYLNSIEINDPISKQWNLVDHLPENKYVSDATVIGGKVYVVSGRRSANDYSHKVFVADLKPPISLYYRTAGSGGTPSAGSVTLDMLSPEVQARLENTVLAKSTSTAPAGYVLQRLDMDYHPQVLHTTLGGRSGYGKVGQKIYLLDHEGVGIDVFDLETNSSSNKQATSSNPTRSHGVASLNGLVYAIGGTISNVPTNRVRSYDPAANSYTELSTMNRAREHPFPITFNNKIYVFGGINQSGRVDAVERYDPVANTWTEVSQLPVPVRSNHEQICPVVVGQKLYVLIPHPSSKIGYLYHYNGEDTWVRKADFPHPEEGGGNREVTFSHGNKFFVVGKSTYDEATNQWLPTRYGSWNHGGSSVSNTIVCFVEGDKMISIGGTGSGIMSMDLSKIRYFFVSDGDSNGSFSGGGTPATGSITLDMLSPEVKARLTDANGTASAPVGATLFMPYGVKGTPVSGGNTYTVPDGKVLITGHYRGAIKVNGNEVNFYSSGDGTNDAVNDVVILPSGTSFSTTINNSPGGGFIGMLFDNRPDITAVVGGGGYSVPAGKTFFLTSASGRVNGLSRRPAIGKIPLILGSGSGFGLTDGPNQTSPGFTGYLKDN